MTAAKQKALNALLVTSTIREAAKLSGISERSIMRYLKDPDFRAEYERACRAVLDDTTRVLQKGSREAAMKLLSILSDPSQNGQTQLTAANKVLEHALRFSEFNDILKEAGEQDVL